MILYSNVNYKGEFEFSFEVYPDYDYTGTMNVGAPYFSDIS